MKISNCILDAEEFQVLKTKSVKARFLIYVSTYSIFFITIFALGFQDFFLEQGKSFIWYLDGTKQHFPFLYDLSEIVKGLVFNGEGIPLWSWQIGLGGDIIQSYAYYVLGDPFSYFAAILLPLSKMELGYNFIIVMRLYFVGFSLLYYCKYMGLTHIPSVIGSLIYAFSGHILFWGLRHPFFINPAILLPLLFIGIEEIFKNKKPYMFILCIAISAFSSFYFCYMNTIAIFIYATIRFHYYVKQERMKYYLKMLFRIGCYYLLGISIAAISFIPAIYGFLNTYRVPSTWEFDYKLTLEKCKKMFNLFFIIDNDRKILRLSLGFISIPSILLFWCLRDRLSRSYKALFVVFTIIIFLPFMHSTFNGFSAQNDRWVYIYISITSFIVAYSLDKIKLYKNSSIVYWILFSFGYLGILHNNGSLNHFIFIILGCICFAISLYKFNIKPLNDRVNSNGFLEIALLLLITVNLMTNVESLMSPKNYGGSFMKYGAVPLMYERDKTKVVALINEHDFYRIGYDDMSDNKSVIHNFNGTHIYNSIIDKDIINFYNYHRIRTKLGTSAYMGFDEISPLNYLLGVRYYIGNKKIKHIVPYGFESKMIVDESIIYENKNPLPIGFMYYHTLEKKEVDKLIGLDRIYSNLDGAVVEDSIEGISSKLPIARSQELDFKIISEDGVTLSDQKAMVSKNGGSIVLQIESVPHSELFLQINRVFYENQNKNFQITVETENVKKTIETRSVKNTYYIDNRDYLFHLGYKKNSDFEVKISFPHKGEYSFEAMSVLGIQMKNFNGNINYLKESTLNNITYDNHFISGNVDVMQKGILFLSIPHTPGWKAYVDGKKVETLKVNIGFTGIVLDEGNHEITLKYMSPFLILSVVVSISGLCIFMMMILADYRKIKRTVV